MYEKLGLGTSENERSATAQGIATASQESVDELNGRMTAVQGHTFRIAENSDIITAAMNDVNSNVALIERHTNELHEIRFNIQDLKGIVSTLAQ